MVVAPSSNMGSFPALQAKLISTLFITNPNSKSFKLPSKTTKFTTLTFNSPNYPFAFHLRRHSPPLHALQDEKGETDGQEQASEDQRKLYIGNLPYSTTSSQLQELFIAAGNVVNVEIIYDRATDRSRGFAFVTMGTMKEAETAIGMFNGSQIQGRAIKVNFPEVPKGAEREVMSERIRTSNKAFVDSPYKIYAGNLGWRLTSEGLRNAFSEQRGLMGAKVIYERGTGRSRGFGFVSFETVEDAEAALTAMDGIEVEGRPLRLNLAAENSRSQSSLGNEENDAGSSELLSSVGA